MRASDADRQRTIRRLSAGYAAGRLGSDTYAHRLDLAFRAGSRADLNSLTADLSGRVRGALASMREAATGWLAVPRVQLPSVWLEPAGEGPWSIGRSPDNDMVIDDPTVSRHHAELRWTPGGYTLTDLESLNGCVANGMRVQAVLLRPGDELILGQVRVRLAQRT